MIKLQNTLLPEGLGHQIWLMKKLKHWLAVLIYWLAYGWPILSEWNSKILDRTDFLRIKSTLIMPCCICRLLCAQFTSIES